MSERPYVLLSCAMSADGYIDDATPERLRLSSAADWDRVDAVRASCDAILAGAGTLRADDPRLLIRSAARRERRVARGLPADLTKVTLTWSGDLDPGARFFTTGEAPKLVYAPSTTAVELAPRLTGAAEVIDAGDPLDLPTVLGDLAARGVRRLMVEGGGGVHTLFLTADVVDEIQLVVAPFFIGDPSAPRFVRSGVFPQSPERPMRLDEVTRIGDLALLRYLIGAARG
ncbi:RibD family protein [Actinomadura madurae]|uniref:RibD family protein n=1 Tax=Actinomadura madurae TaxID=1993 RepID=UPI0020271021|nr:dihydrofolate reductase family protein [Actinomadura madurae]MCP9948855.1 dihydrofolate reductase family protein [Actinomadura madurae]MCP9965633.1 dihydrofolate reductase family protein [Actinomadura madurae]MCP9978106.1 dihydrofolate reductase family protein [Actinomadura madurae]MCQ0010380.1 dihydrofolate reductase family protein [Actinomadura madurae]MCQ0014307.1 dihydrofolate reductase family protein [Actinomadura madurae]